MGDPVNAEKVAEAVVANVTNASVAIWELSKDEVGPSPPRPVRQPRPSPPAQFSRRCGGETWQMSSLLPLRGHRSLKMRQTRVIGGQALPGAHRGGRCTAMWSTHGPPSGRVRCKQGSRERGVVDLWYSRFPVHAHRFSPSLGTRAAGVRQPAATADLPASNVPRSPPGTLWYPASSRVALLSYVVAEQWHDWDCPPPNTQHLCSTLLLPL